MRFPSRAGLGSMAYKKRKWIITCKKRCVVPVKTIARSKTLEESEKAIAALKDSEIWKTNAKFSIYFSKHWLTVKEVRFLFLFHDNSLENLDTP